MLNEISDMKQILFCLLFFFGHMTVNAQFTYFNNRYNNDNWSAALSIVETESGYVSCGVSGVISGENIFKRIVLQNIDDQGNLVWWKTYGEEFHNYYSGGIRGFIKTLDGGFAVSGVIEDEIKAVGVLMKFDQNGNSLWSRIYGDTVSLTYSYNNIKVCIQLPDKGYLITGNIYISGDDGDIILIRTDSLGNTMWERTYGELHWIEGGFWITQLPEGQFLIGISKQHVGNNTTMDPGMLKVDSLGNQIWINYYGGIYDDAGAAVILSQDGNYLFGSTYAIAEPAPGYPIQKAWLFKTDTAGNMLWEKKYTDKTNFLGWCSTIDELSDGSIIMSGTGIFEDAPGYLGWILKTDEEGDSIWMRRYSLHPFGDNHLNDLRTTSENGIIITGMTMGDPEWEQSIWVQKLDSIGCDSVGCDTTVGIWEGHGSGEAWKQGNLMIWPNPASEWIHVLFRVEKPDWNAVRKLELYNVFGEKVIETNIPKWSNSYDCNVSMLSGGIYLAIIREKQKVLYSGKIIISR
jgi:hypothetical protein